MLLLTFDTSSKVCTVALSEDDKVLIEFTLNVEFTHSEFLLLLIQQAMSTAKLELSAVEAIGVVIGPGSFTGLRIGLSVAKGLGLAINCPVYTFTSLEVLAASYWGVTEPVMAIISAQRGEVYAGLFDCSAGRPLLQNQYFIGKIAEEVQEKLTEFDRFYLAGNDTIEFHDIIEQSFGDRVANTTYFQNMNHAGAIVALLVSALATRNEPAKIDSMEPFYMRLSAAEQRRLEKEQTSDKS